MSEYQLKKHQKFSGRKGPQLIVVMDGIGIGPDYKGNAVQRANMPVLRNLMAKYQWTALQAHGTAVGLPSDDDMGNSEVGHNALGAGRVFAQGAKLVNTAIESGAMFEGKTWKKMVSQVVSHNTTLHFCGLLSDGNVHSHQKHLYAMLRQADKEGVKCVRVHPLLDGRDVPPTSALEYIQPLEALLKEISAKPDRDYRIASGGGRMVVTMDRYWANAEVVERGWKAHVRGEGRKFSSAEEAIATYRSETPGLQDQNMMEFVIVDQKNEPIGRVVDGDAFIYFNFRGDRAIEISCAFEQESFSFFNRGPVPKVLYAGMMQYDGDMLMPTNYLVSPPAIERTMGEILVRNGHSLYACSETQKYGHVTYFWNGNRSGKFDEKLETYHEIASDKVLFNERPWMKGAEITDELIAALRSGKYKQLRINYPNGDMVGHTGDIDAAIIATETVDLCLARLLPVIEEVEGVAFFTADHGNADEMLEYDKKTLEVKLDKKGAVKPVVSHTLNPVPFVIFDPQYKGEYTIKKDLKGGLANVAATAFNLLGYEAPEDYKESLITFDK